jgi:hypothetical protein
MNYRIPEAIKCYTIYWCALRQGRLVKGTCEVCGSAKVDGHHRDLDKPLEVVWLCRKHHRLEHMKNPIDRRKSQYWLGKEQSIESNDKRSVSLKKAYAEGRR